MLHCREYARTSLVQTLAQVLAMAPIAATGEHLVKGPLGKRASADRLQHAVDGQPIRALRRGSEKSAAQSRSDGLGEAPHENDTLELIERRQSRHGRAGGVKVTVGIVLDDGQAKLFSKLQKLEGFVRGDLRTSRIMQ